MKKISLLLIILLMAGIATMAQNYTMQVHGYVYTMINNSFEPVPGQPVDIMIDSTNTGWTYMNTVITDDSGYYEDVITPPENVGFGYVQTMTFDMCTGNFQYNGQFFAPGATMTGMDFYLCGTVSSCQAMFYYYHSPADPYAYNFVNISTGNFTDVLWDFGDGITSTTDNPVHIYAGPGIYSVCLTITGPDDCNSTYCEPVYVGNSGGGCDNYFMWYPTDPSGTTIAFEGYLMTGQQASSYEWDFGDGTTGSGQFISHTYSIPPNGNAIFMVSLTTTYADSNGTVCTFTSWQEVWLYQPGGCSNFFYYEQTDSTTFTFYGEAYLNNGTTSSETTYMWDFGDGTTGIGQTITHMFEPNPAGIYTVCLTTIMMLPDGDSCYAVSCQDVWMVQPAFGIYGFVYLQNNQFADYADVHLMTMDTLWQNVIEVATTTLDSSGFYSFENVPLYNNRIYYVQAELTEASAYFGEYLPTYHLSALNWELADPIFPLWNWTCDIYMIAGTPLNSGNGTITGTVTNLGTRGILENVEVVLMDSQMNPHFYTRSDEQGTFSFENLPYGTYVIHAEIMGIHTNQATVTLTEGQPEVGIEIQVSGDEANVVFGINEQKIAIEDVGNIYPNPVTDHSRMDISLKEPAQVEFSIYNQLGQLADVNGELLSSGKQSVMISTEGLQPGLYLLRITTTSGDLVTRRFVKAQ